MYFGQKYGETSAAYHLRHLAVTRFVRFHMSILVRKGLVRKPKTEGDRIWIEWNFPKTVISRYFENC